MSNKTDDELAKLDALVGKLAEGEAAEAEREAASPRGQKALRELADLSDELIRKARLRALEEASASSREAVPVPTRILEMTREAILSRLAELRAMLGGDLAVQYRQLDEQSTEDLRTLLADVEALLPNQESEA